MLISISHLMYRVFHSIELELQSILGLVYQSVSWCTDNLAKSEVNFIWWVDCMVSITYPEGWASFV